jgi:microtubule-associated protein-like 6
VLATADDDGRVKLFKYPCVVEKGALYNEYKGHSSHVTKCKFSADDAYVVTTGGHDKTVLIWETDFGGATKKPQTAAIQEEEKGFEMMDDEVETFTPKRVDLSKSIKLESKAIALAARSPTKKAIEEVEEGSMFEVVEVGDGE